MRITTVILISLFFTAAVATDEAVAVRTGAYSIEVAVSELMDAQSHEALYEVVTKDASVEWEVYVPESYSADKPAGILVYISPLPSAQIPRRWKAVLDRHNLIWVGANRAGNQVMTKRRMLLAALAPVFVQDRYAVNTDRIFAAGLSGGGRVTSIVAIEFAQLFKGAIFICGVNPPVAEQPVLLDLIQQNRFVFLTGSKDFNKNETKKVYSTYRDLGVQNIKLMVIPHMSHRNPDALEFEEAIRYLDADLHMQ